jgi:hypothetical protein
VNIESIKKEFEKIYPQIDFSKIGSGSIAHNKFVEKREAVWNFIESKLKQAEKESRIEENNFYVGMLNDIIEKIPGKCEAEKVLIQLHQARITVLEAQ